MRARTGAASVQSETPDSVTIDRWRRRAYQMANRAIEDYRAKVRDEVLRVAEQLRREAAGSPGHRALAQDLVTRLAHHVVRIAPPLPRIEGEYERTDSEERASRGPRAG